VALILVVKLDEPVLGQPGISEPLIGLVLPDALAAVDEALEILLALLTKGAGVPLLEKTLWVEPAVPLLDRLVASLPVADDEEDRLGSRRLELLEELEDGGSEEDSDVDVEAEEVVFECSEKDCELEEDSDVDVEAEEVVFECSEKDCELDVVDVEAAKTAGSVYYQQAPEWLFLGGWRTVNKKNDRLQKQGQPAKGPHR